jgi:hypothetical protein
MPSETTPEIGQIGGVNSSFWILRRSGASSAGSSRRVLNGPFVILDIHRMQEILAALARAGFDCILDEKLVLKACGDEVFKADDRS